MSSAFIQTITVSLFNGGIYVIRKKRKIILHLSSANSASFMRNIRSI